jgi:hypothetical protein
LSADQRPASPARRDQRGQATVEFAVVAIIAILTLTGIIAGSFMYFQNEAVTNGARGGARWATVESNLYSSSSGTLTCEGGSPDSIVNQVKKATNVLPVNTAPLCAISNTELQQNPIDWSKANIVVDAYPNLSAPTCVTVTVTYKAQPLAIPVPGPITMQAHSSQPFITFSSSSTSTSASASQSCPAAHSPTTATSSGTTSSSTSVSTSTTSTTTSTTTTTTTKTSTTTSSTGGGGGD